MTLKNITGCFYQLLNTKYLLGFLVIQVLTGCAICEYENYLLNKNTKSYQQNIENMKNREGVVMDFGFSHSEYRKGIPFIFEIITTGGPYIPGAKLTVFKKEFDSVDIKSATIDIRNNRINLLKEKSNKKKLEYNKFYDEYIAHYTFLPINIESTSVKSFKATIVVSLYKDSGEVINRTYKYEFKKKYEKGIDFFHAWSGD